MMAGPPRAAINRLGLQLTRDKADTLLLLAAAALVLGPHAGHLPPWVSLVCACTMAWRGLITWRGTRMPPSIVLLPLAILAMGAVFVTYKTLLGREAGVAMAVLLLAFKMLEMHAKRDLFVVIYLCFFLVLTNFFYSQGIGTGALMVVSIIVLLTAQLTFQYTGTVPPLARRLRLGATILGAAAPLALAMFFLFPRIQGPLWGMPGDAHGAHTGMSNSMSPGNISELAQSTEIAFRVKFGGAPPGQRQLYWRGMVLGQFDGRTWSQARQRARAPMLAVRGAPVSYQVTLEPTGQHWLFALDMPHSIPLMDDNLATVNGNIEMRTERPIDERVRYDIDSQLDYRLDADALPDGAEWLALPDGFNPRTRQAGHELQREPDPVKRVNTVLQRFRKDTYSYTLAAPLLGTDSVDEFLYQTKAGFCEHYASAFVFLMRAAGVPARVVTGYQGGEINPVDGFLAVRQSDAHAWAEVWIAQRGWVRVDPTAAVSPDRVERSLAHALPPETMFGQLISVGLDNTSWLARLRFRLSAINNGWNQWVLNYDPQRQRMLLDTLADSMSDWRAVLGLAAVLILAFVARARRLRSETDPVDTLYSALCLQMGRLGLARCGDEGPNAYATRAAGMALAPEKKEALLRFLSLYSAYKYGAQAPERDLVPTLKRLLNSI